MFSDTLAISDETLQYFFDEPAVGVSVQLHQAKKLGTFLFAHLMHCGFLLTKQGDDNITAELSAFFGQGDALILAVFGQLAELVIIRSAVMVADDGGDTIDITAVACGKNGLRGENDGRPAMPRGMTAMST